MRNRKMNYTVFALGVWSLIQVAISLWGISIIDNDCKNKSLFSKLRIMLNITAVYSVIIWANFVCNYTCYEKNSETPLFIAILTMISSLTVLSIQPYVLQNIGDCAKSTDYYKMAILSAGITTSIFPLLYGGVVIVRWFRKVKKERGGEKKSKNQKNKGWNLWGDNKSKGKNKDDSDDNGIEMGNLFD